MAPVAECALYKGIGRFGLGGRILWLGMDMVKSLHPKRDYVECHDFLGNSYIAATSE